MAKDNRVKENFIELRAKGLSYDKISEKLNVSKPTLIEWSKEFSIEINNLKAIELETIQEKYFMLKKQRIQDLGKILAKINKAIDERDLSSTNNDKLLELKIKYINELRKEFEPTLFQYKKNQLEFEIESVEEWEG